MEIILDSSAVLLMVGSTERTGWEYQESDSNDLSALELEFSKRFSSDSEAESDD